MTIEEMVREMLRMQDALDKQVEAEHHILMKDLDVRQVYAALLDEVGELNHEMKARWCWWKHTQEHENPERVLEELADVWHFVLMIQLIRAVDDDDETWWTGFIDGVTEAIAMRDTIYPCGFIQCYVPGLSTGMTMGNEIMALTAFCGFTLAEVYEAYKKKNATNLRRLEEGY